MIYSIVNKNRANRAKSLTPTVARSIVSIMNGSRSIYREADVLAGFGIADLAALLFVVAVVLFLTLGSAVYESTYAFSPVVVAFVQFALLSTFGKMLVSRVRHGRYLPRAFGVVPKLIVSGLVGVLVYSAFTIFEAGVTELVFPTAPITGLRRVAWAFSISFFMNLLFAPLLMTLHRVSDHYIRINEGRFPIREFRPGDVLSEINWSRLWGFILLRTVPLFWLPAHTVTFLLPPAYRLVYAAGLTIVLGLLMSLADHPAGRPEVTPPTPPSSRSQRESRREDLPHQRRLGKVAPDLQRPRQRGR